MEEPLAKPASQTHKQNSIVLIFRGEFLCPQKSCNFDTYTQYTVHHDFSNALEIIPEFLFFTGIQSHEY